MNYNIYTDPGHAWVKVTKAEVKRLNVKPSSCSYMDGEYVFLEEDKDAPEFMTVKLKLKEPISFCEYYTDSQSKIRTYKQYSPEEKENE